MKVNLVGLALVLTLVGTTATQATDLQRLTFTKHAAFFSSETKQPKPVDPHVFLQDPASPAATGPQNIQHIAGVRPAHIEQDAKTTPLFNAKGESLGFDFGQWLGANGKSNDHAVGERQSQNLSSVQQTSTRRRLQPV
jgi:hypothetical protein